MYLFTFLLFTSFSFGMVVPEGFEGSLTLTDYGFVSAVAGIFSALVFWVGINRGL